MSSWLKTGVKRLNSYWGARPSLAILKIVGSAAIALSLSKGLRLSAMSVPDKLPHKYRIRLTDTPKQIKIRLMADFDLLCQYY